MMHSNVYDVIVTGGGLAGCAAAVASARRGARTLLIERYGFLGGWATAGLVSPFMSHRTSDGRVLVTGLFQEICDRLSHQGGLKGNTFDSEAMKSVLQEMVLESGSVLRLHTQVDGARSDQNGGIVISMYSKSRREEINCFRTVDCTGDGDVAVALGASYASGDANGLPQAVTLMFDVGGVDLERVMQYVRDHPDQMLFPKLPPDADPEELADGVISVAGYYDLVANARAAGEYDVPGDMIFFLSRPRRGEVVFNTTHVGRVDGTSAEDLTRAEIESRRQMICLVAFVRNHVPGFEEAYLLRSAAHVGVRETRRITGDYVFSASDVVRGAKFADCICRLAYPVDVHPGEGRGYTKEEAEADLAATAGAPPPGDWYEIPYRCLLPQGIDNVLVAGRCVSSTQAGHGAIRIMPACVAMGEAAGKAAALSLEQEITPRELDHRLAAVPDP